MKKKRYYCQPLSLARLNVWLWTTCLLFLSIIIQLEIFERVSTVAIILAVGYVVLVVYLLRSSFLIVTDQLDFDLHFPFSRQALSLSRQQLQDIQFTKHTVTITVNVQQTYRFFTSTRQLSALRQVVERIRQTDDTDRY